MELLTTSRYFTLFTKLENINNGAVCIKAHLPLILKLDFTRAKKEHKKPNKECLSKAEQYGVGKMQDWQEEILEREGFYKIKTERMRTQRDDLKDQAKALEAQLTAATKYGDGIDLMDIYRKLDKVKSLIEAIR